jgi:hypothetical protein
MDFTIVTAWYDVREKENHPMKDKTTNDFFPTTHEYFDKNKQKFLNKPFPMVIYTEPRFEQMIKEQRPKHLHPFTRFIFKDYEELPFYSLFNKYEENHHKNPVQNLDTTKFTPLYKFIVNQKTNFVKEVAEMNPFNTTHFAWMDLRLHCVYDMSPQETVDTFATIQEDKVRMMFMSYLPTDQIWGRHDFYSWTRGKIAAGFFGGRAKPIIEFARLCQKEFVDAINEGMAPSDEMIYSFVTAHNTRLFEPYVGEYGDCLRNMSMARCSGHLFMPFFYSSFDRQNWSYTSALFDNISQGFLNNQIHLSNEDIYNVWYRGFISNANLGRPEKSRIILENLIELYKNNRDIPFQNGRDQFIEKSNEFGHTDVVDSINSL